MQLDHHEINKTKNQIKILESSNVDYKQTRELIELIIFFMQFVVNTLEVLKENNLRTLYWILQSQDKNQRLRKRSLNHLGYQQ